MVNLDPRGSLRLLTGGLCSLPWSYIKHDWLEYDSVKWEIPCILLAICTCFQTLAWEKIHNTKLTPCHSNHISSARTTVTAAKPSRKPRKRRDANVSQVPDKGPVWAYL